MSVTILAQECYVQAARARAIVEPVLCQVAHERLDMPVALFSHTVLLTSDGTAVACGDNEYGQCNMPDLGDLTYAQVAAGSLFTVLIRSDGTAVACGSNSWGQCGGDNKFSNCDIIDRGFQQQVVFVGSEAPGCSSECRTYVQVTAGAQHTVFLRSDGTALACGENFSGQCDIPVPRNLTYTLAAAGNCHTVLLRSDGTAVAFGCNYHDQSVIPDPGDLRYSQIAAGESHTVLLRSDGTVVACGHNDYGQCSTPDPGGLSYTQVAAGGVHTVLLRSDGTAVACGDNKRGQCNLPDPGDLTYAQVAAGSDHTVLLRSDGTAVACGDNRFGQCNIPDLGDITYVAMPIAFVKPKVVILQASFNYSPEGCLNKMLFDNMNGNRELEFQVQAADLLVNILARIEKARGVEQFEVVLPKGHLMSLVAAQHASATLADYV